jgi:hypothetical protein
MRKITVKCCECGKDISFHDEHNYLAGMLRSAVNYSEPFDNIKMIVKCCDCEYTKEIYEEMHRKHNEPSLSGCCGAIATVEGSGEGTYYYLCSKCKQPCDCK